MNFIDDIRDKLKSIRKLQYVEQFRPLSIKKDYYYLYTITEEETSEFSIGFKTKCLIKVLLPESPLGQNKTIAAQTINKILKKLVRGEYGKDKFVQQVSTDIDVQLVEESLYMAVISCVFTWEVIN